MDYTRFLEYAKRPATNRKPSTSLTDRLWSRIQKGAADECWPWTHKVDKDGYGTIYADGRPRGAHRIVYLLSVGPIPDGLLVRHSCDNPPCCNTAHLIVGTQTDNVADRVSRNRTARGDRSGARLHPERVPRGERHGTHTHPESYPKGDAHYSRTNPERLARGDRNGMRRHPESVVRGDKHANMKITDADVARVRAWHSMPRGTKPTQKEIAAMFGVSRRLIQAICYGQARKIS
jgi:hypothetical protein